MKKYLYLLFALVLLPLASPAQKQVDARYAAGAVPVVDGFVKFEQQVSAPGRSKADICEALKQYVETHLVEGPEQLPVARITEFDPAAGVLAASIGEYMYFKRTNWQTHRVRFYYQLVVEATDGAARVSLRNLHYSYDPEVTDGDFADDRRAEDWITDEQALTKNGKKLARISGKFRTHTIDRKDQLFSDIEKALAQ